MKLTWGHPFWPAVDGAASGMAEWPALDEDVRCDVLVIGGGISGALVADALVGHGLDVVMVDKRQPGHGSTAASTALLLYELDTPLEELIGRVGRPHAERAYRLGIEAIEWLAHAAGELEDSCGFVRRKSLYLASRAGDVEGLRREGALRRRIGIKVDELSDADLLARFGFVQPGALLSHEAAEVDPYRLARQLIGRAERRGGLRIYGRTHVTRLDLAGDRACALTHDGPRVSARHVVVASGYEAVGPHGGGLATARATYALASQPMDRFPGWWERCLIWETARPYLYLRTTPDGRALIGGEDDAHVTSAGDRAHLARKCRTLQTRFNQLFPDIPIEPEAMWAGVFETTPDGLPYVGRRPGYDPRVLFALGYGGNGITFSVMAAQIIRDLILGRPNADADLFRFDRGTR